MSYFLLVHFGPVKRPAPCPQHRRRPIREVNPRSMARCYRKNLWRLEDGERVKRRGVANIKRQTKPSSESEKWEQPVLGIIRSFLQAPFPSSPSPSDKEFPSSQECSGFLCCFSSTMFVSEVRLKTMEPDMEHRNHWRIVANVCTGKSKHVLGMA